MQHSVQWTSKNKTALLHRPHRMYSSPRACHVDLLFSNNPPVVEQGQIIGRDSDLPGPGPRSTLIPLVEIETGE